MHASILDTRWTKVPWQTTHTRRWKRRKNKCKCMNTWKKTTNCIQLFADHWHISMMLVNLTRCIQMHNSPWIVAATSSSSSSIRKYYSWKWASEMMMNIRLVCVCVCELIRQRFSSCHQLICLSSVCARRTDEWTNCELFYSPFHICITVFTVVLCGNREKEMSYYKRLCCVIVVVGAAAAFATITGNNRECMC